MLPCDDPSDTEATTFPTPVVPVDMVAQNSLLDRERRHARHSRLFSGGRGVLALASARIAEGFQATGPRASDAALILLSQG